MEMKSVGQLGEIRIEYRRKLGDLGFVFIGLETLEAVNGEWTWRKMTRSQVAF